MDTHKSVNTSENPSGADQRDEEFVPSPDETADADDDDESFDDDDDEEDDDEDTSDIDDKDEG